MTDQQTSRQLDPMGVAGAVLCCALWGGNAVAVKFSVPEIPPFGCAAARFAIALPVIVLGCLYTRQPLRVRREFWGILALHATLTVFQVGLFNWGTSRSLAGRAAVFINVHPFMVALLAWVVLKERMGFRGLSGLVAAALGVLLLLASATPLGTSVGGGGGILVGDLVVLSSGIIFGGQTVFQKLTFPRIAPGTLLLCQTLVALPIFVLYSLTVEGLSSYQPTVPALWGVLYQGLAASGVCIFLWMTLLRRYSAGRLAALAFLTPLFGVGFGALMRGEPLHWELVAAGALVGAGIYLVASDRVEPLTTTGEDAP